MRTDIVFTLTGPDRVGIVEDVTGALLSIGGSVGTSRMARLGGAFAILMSATLPAARAGELESALGDLVSQGYKLTIESATEAPETAYEGWATYRIELSGADHEGIVHEIAHGLSQRGINIESIETWTSRASVTGSPLFNMTATVMVPPSLDAAAWMADLAEAGEHANVDITVTPAE